jgi:hypothetical protein
VQHCFCLVSEAHIPCPVPLCTVDHPSAGGGKFPPRSTIFPCHLPLLLTALYGQIEDPPPLPQSTEWRNCGFSVGNFMMLLSGRHQSWIGFGLRLFPAGVCLIQRCPVAHNIITYCRCRDAAKLFRFRLPAKSLIGTRNKLQNCTSR